jgi:exosortase D (VPLPA-CTERM-specific)
VAAAALILSALATLGWQHAAMLQMWDTWIQRPEYSHGPLLPLLAAWILWRERHTLVAKDARSTWWALPIVILGATLAVLGDLATLYAAVQYGIVLILIGLLVAWMGAANARRIWIVSVLLLLMVPLPNFLLNNLSVSLQLLSSQLGVGLVRLAGISVYLEGNVIDLGGYQLQVAEACDGMRYLFPLATIAFIMAYFYRAAFWKKALLFLSSIPITIAMNSIRIGTIGVLVDRWGIGMAEGFLHEFQGWLVFMLCLALLIGEIMLMSRLGRNPRHWRELLTFDTPVDAPTGVSAALRPTLTPALLSVSACAIVVALLGSLLPQRAEAALLRRHFSEFPLAAGEWQGRRQALEKAYLDVLQLDDYLLADFTSAPAHAFVNLYVAYYDSQRKGQSAHSPRSCIPGGGWRISSITPRALTVATGAMPIMANRVVIERDTDRQVLYYWFSQRGRSITNEYAVKWYIFMDAVVRNRTDGAMIRISAPQLPGQTEADVDRALATFAKQMVPRLTPYIPG